MQVSEAQLIASICRESYIEFVKTFWHIACRDPMIWNWHMDVVCNELQRVAERVFLGLPKEYDLLINQPPGTTKSLLTSVLYSAWVWTRMPTACVIGGSYSYQPVALNFARFTRDVITSELYRACFPEIQLREDMNQKGYFINTSGGYRYAVGVGGSVTSMHGHILVVDDPIDPEAALSDVELDRANHWMGHTLSTRKKDMRVTPTILVMQRLHQNDPSAEFRNSGETVRHICLPATLEYPVKPEELASQYVDGLLSPIRHPPEVLEIARKKLSTYGFSGQYGQQPVPAGGGMFQTAMIKPLPAPDKFRSIVRFWDKAATAPTSKLGKRSAWTVGCKMALDHSGMVWVLDVIRVRMDSHNREQLIHRTARRDGRHVEIGVEQEPGSSGKDSALATVQRLRGFRVRIYPASGSKEIRADEFSIQVNAGNVVIPSQFRVDGRWVSWTAEFMEELRHWPFSTYKDQGDASSGAWKMLARSKTRVGTLRMKARSSVV